VPSQFTPPERRSTGSHDRIEAERRGTIRLLFALAAVERMTGSVETAPIELDLADVDADLDRELARFPGAPSRPSTPASDGQDAERGQAGDTHVPVTRQTAKTTCLVADDHPIVSEAIRRVLVATGIEVVAVVGSGREAVAQIEAHRPQVALVDLRLPELDGVEVTERVSRSTPETGVILYTGADALMLSNALGSSARGFLLKEAPVGDVTRAVNMVAEGHTYIDPALAGFLAGTAGSRDLTRRELEILRLLAEGLSNETIAERLYFSPETVRNDVRQAMAKLNAQTRSEAVAVAVRERLIA
jgi:DNA-binding NarL/FixJ family response regulator